jgi:hypothetical protein
VYLFKLPLKHIYQEKMNEWDLVFFLNFGKRKTKKNIFMPHERFRHETRNFTQFTSNLFRNSNVSSLPSNFYQRSIKETSFASRCSLGILIMHKLDESIKVRKNIFVKESKQINTRRVCVQKNSFSLNIFFCEGKRNYELKSQMLKRFQFPAHFDLFHNFFYI